MSTEKAAAAAEPRALHPALPRHFLAFAPSAEFHVLERSGSFGHVEVPRILRDFWARTSALRLA
ncbi:hypothetical protein [Polyangium jinanense]|uniref:Uncharacterized protein n=1 Tax=Polyangium jinanense TaxID=2829994 RepID=A0A9X3XA50_9BACT|nr:hypothetical protein [Polyangium jinanense]MDC3961411.1 hypothetical protein [Polyangium jinanense]MDC3987012.1 hypothetical protein [Polyangium jinanense]